MSNCYRVAVILRPKMPSPIKTPDIILDVIDQLPEDLPRQIVDGLPKLRILAGPRLAEHLSSTPTADRTWAGGFTAGMIGATDFIDGIWARRIGTTDYGRELDREGDRSFVMPQQKALKNSGEVPAAHYGLKVAREYAMQGLRAWGEHNGKDLTSLQVNRQKTTFEMGTLAAAHSPLAQNEDLIRWGAAVGTALSLTGLFETAFNYMKEDPDKEVDTARNSTAREVSASPLGKLAGLIDEKAPGVTPSHITKWGKRLVEGSAALAVARPDSPALATTIYTLGSLADTVDGALARKKGEDGVDGMVEDVQADLEQQIATFAALSIIARKRGNKVAAANYALATMTTSLSALTRADAESRGLIVAEGGLGTRVGRGILGGVGMGLNKHRDISDIISATIASGTINTVLQRRDAAKNGPDSQYAVGANHDHEFMQAAEVRKDAIVPYALAGLVVGSSLLATPYRSADRPQSS